MITVIYLHRGRDHVATYQQPSPPRIGEEVELPTHAIPHWRVQDVHWRPAVREVDVWVVPC